MNSEAPLQARRSLNLTSAVSLAGVAGFISIVVSLHFMQPGYDPKEQLMSELALGPYGWAMLPAFSFLAIAAFGLQAAIGTFGGKLLLRLTLLTAALCFLASGLFPLGTHSELHILFIASAFVASVLAMYLFPSLSGAAGVRVPKAASWSLAVGVAAGVALGSSVLPMGVGQRVAAVCLLIWFGFVASRLIRA